MYYIIFDSSRNSLIKNNLKDHEKLEQIRGAYQTLSNPELKERYDSQKLVSSMIGSDPSISKNLEAIAGHVNYLHPLIKEYSIVKKAQQSVQQERPMFSKMKRALLGEYTSKHEAEAIKLMTSLDNKLSAKDALEKVAEAKKSKSKSWGLGL